MAELKSKSKAQIKREFPNITVKIEKIVPGGYGLGFAENKTVFVALAAAGDLVAARVREKKGKVIFAEIAEIIESSAHRIAPPCRYFGTCGGCDFQQMNYAAQLEAKTSIVRDCLTRIGKINYEKEIEIIASPQAFGYRARAQWRAETRNKKIGYYKRHSHDIVDIETCPILTPELQAKLESLRANSNWEEFWAEKIKIEAASSGDKVSVYSTELIEPTGELSFEAHGERYFYDATSFFQGNPFLIEKLIETAVKDASGKTALDLFCGVGLFSLPLARRFEKVYAVEAGEKAVEFAEKNAANAVLPNLEFFAEDVAEFILREDFEAVDYVLLDPPRTGAEPKIIENLLKLQPRQITYVSCDPATLARDLKTLSEKYAIDSITAFDLFPQTHHVETIVQLSKIETQNN